MYIYHINMGAMRGEFQNLSRLHTAFLFDKYQEAKCKEGDYSCNIYEIVIRIGKRKKLLILLCLSVILFSKPRVFHHICKN